MPLGINLPTDFTAGESAHVAAHEAVNIAVNATAAAVDALGSFQPLDSDLTAISGLTPSNDDVLQRKSGAWVNRTVAQLAGDLTVSAVQPKDADLTAIAALTPTDDDVLQRKSGVWVNRTAAQLKTDLALTKSDVGLSNVTNNAQVTGVTAGDGTITIGGTSTAPTVAVGTGLAQSKVTNLTTDLAAKLDTTAAPELIRDTIGTALVAGSNVTITPNDGADTITIAATGGGASTVTVLLDPASGVFRSTAFPALTQVNGTTIPVRGLAFDATTLEAVFFRFRAVNYGSGNLTVTLDWYADTATTNAVVWGAAIAALTPTTDTQDTETDALATAATTTTTHLGTTGQRMHRTSITVSSLDSLTAADHVVLQVYRDAANGSDTMTGDCVLVGVAVSYSTT